MYTYSVYRSRESSLYNAAAVGLRTIEALALGVRDSGIDGLAGKYEPIRGTLATAGIRFPWESLLLKGFTVLARIREAVDIFYGGACGSFGIAGGWV